MQTTTPPTRADRPHRHLFHALTLSSTLGLAASLPADTLTVCLDGSCDFAELQAAIDAAADGDVIEISGETYLLDAPLDTAGRSLTFRGTTDPKDGAPRTILDGQGEHQVLTHSNDTEHPRALTFEHLEIRNGRGYSAVRITGPGDVAITNCRFHANLGWHGGALLVANQDSVVTMTDTRFEENTDNDGGYGGAMKVVGCRDLELVRCTLIGNLGGRGGAILSSSQRARFVQCTFRDNRARLDGGAFYGWSAAEVHFEDCSFEGNTADSGGAISFLSGPTRSTTLVDCTFVGNDAEFGYGGAIHSTDGHSWFATNCLFEANRSFDDGGAVYIRASYRDGPPAVQFTDCRFLENDSEIGAGGGLYLMNNSSDLVFEVEITDCLLSGNRAFYGGGLHDWGCALTVRSSTFSGNTAYAWGGGGQFSVFGSGLVSDTRYEGNTAGYRGGAVSVSSSLTFVDCTISDNEALDPGAYDESVEGGGLYTWEEEGTTTIVDSVICSNAPDQAGGGPYRLEGTACIEANCSVACPDETCFADLDGDGSVGSTDLTRLLGDWGCAGSDCASDLDGSGQVDGADLTTILSAWGDCG